MLRVVKDRLEDAGLFQSRFQGLGYPPEAAKTLNSKCPCDRKGPQKKESHFSPPPLSLSVHMYIYIYSERDMYIYIYVYVNVYTFT